MGKGGREEGRKGEGERESKSVCACTRVCEKERETDLFSDVLVWGDDLLHQVSSHLVEGLLLRTTQRRLGRRRGRRIGQGKRKGWEGGVGGGGG